MPLRAKSPLVELDAEAEAAGEAGEFDGGGFGNRQDREPEYARPPRRCEEMVRREKSAGECCKHVSSVCKNFIVNSVRGLNIRTHAGLSDSKSHLFGIRAYREIACLPGQSAPRCFRPRISLSVSAYCENAKKIQPTQIHCPPHIASFPSSTNSNYRFPEPFQIVSMDSELHTLPPNLSLSSFNQGGSNVSERSSDHPSPGRLHKLRSCGFCRSRKIKCDRQKPCANCLRAGSECVYPTEPGRAPKRPRRALDKHVLDRLAHLEVLVRRLGTEVEGGQLPFVAPSEEPAANGGPGSGDESSQVEQQFGRLVIDETRSCYVSNILWSSLGNEVCTCRCALGMLRVT